MQLIKNLHFFLTFRRQKPTILTWRAVTQRPMASLVATSKLPNLASRVIRLNLTLKWTDWPYPLTPKEELHQLERKDTQPGRRETCASPDHHASHDQKVNLSLVPPPLAGLGPLTSFDQGHLPAWPDEFSCLNLEYPACHNDLNRSGGLWLVLTSTLAAPTLPPTGWRLRSDVYGYDIFKLWTLSILIPPPSPFLFFLLYINKYS